MKCIHGDVREYLTKLATIAIGTQTFTCRVGVVPCLDCGVLFGWDSLILSQLLQKFPPHPKPKAVKALQAEATEVELSVHQEELAWLTGNDPLLWFARANAQAQLPLVTEKAPVFTLGHVRAPGP